MDIEINSIAPRHIHCGGDAFDTGKGRDASADVAIEGGDLFGRAAIGHYGEVDREDSRAVIGWLIIFEDEEGSEVCGNWVAGVMGDDREASTVKGVIGVPEPEAVFDRLRPYLERGWSSGTSTAFPLTILCLVVVIVRVLSSGPLRAKIFVVS